MARALDIRRGVERLLMARGEVCLAEFPIAHGRRLDLLALDRSGMFTAIEIKSCPADLRADGKWPQYLAFADRFCFAVGPEFPLDRLPEEEGVLVADRYEAVILREPRLRPLKAARRRALLLRFARTAASRLARLADDGAEALP
jgi:hypothetical protein